jgi:uncharacterized protein (TIGR02118 family)
MVKLIELYRTPENQKEFDNHYETVHTHLVRRIPGLRKLEVAKITGAPIGEYPYYLMAEIYFDNQEAMQTALSTPEGKSTARDLMNFAAKLVTLLFAEVQ